MNSLFASFNAFVVASVRWSSPWWWVCTACALATISVLGVLPLRVPMMKEDVYGFHDLLKIGIRRVALYSLAFLLLGFWPLLFAATALSLAPSAEIARVWVMQEIGRQGMHWGWLLGVALIGGAASRLAVLRYLQPWLSSLAQRFVVRQPDQRPTDMRDEVGRLKTRDFEPRMHYRADQVFLGLDIAGRPTYLPAKTFRETHLQVVGPTRFGKGVALGVIMEQAIAAGHSVVYIDPKSDKFAPYIMAEACERAGRKFVYVDLNGDHTKWAPFEGGSDRDRRSRILACFGMNNTGDGSDFYKSQERAVLDTVMQRSGTSIAGLRAALDAKGPDGKHLRETALRMADGLVELAAVPALNPKKGCGVKIADALKSGASIYLRGSLDDPTIKRATRVFMTEVIQEARRLAPDRSAHLTLAIDELKFMISQEVSDALATIAGFNVNMIMLHQSIHDLRGPEDRSLNVQALESGVIVNCQVKLLYRAADQDTAAWASKLSGTKVVQTTKSTAIEYNLFGGEAFENKRTVGDTELPIVSPNEMLSLSPRVGVLFAPDRLASVVFTSFVPADTGRVLYQCPQDKVAAAAAKDGPGGEERPEKPDSSGENTALVNPAPAAADAATVPTQAQPKPVTNDKPAPAKAHGSEVQRAGSPAAGGSTTRQVAAGTSAASTAGVQTPRTATQPAQSDKVAAAKVVSSGEVRRPEPSTTGQPVRVASGASVAGAVRTTPVVRPAALPGQGAQTATPRTASSAEGRAAVHPSAAQTTRIGPSVTPASTSTPAAAVPGALVRPVQGEKVAAAMSNGSKSGDGAATASGSAVSGHPTATASAAESASPAATQLAEVRPVLGESVGGTHILDTGEARSDEPPVADSGPSTTQGSGTQKPIPGETGCPTG